MRAPLRSRTRAPAALLVGALLVASLALATACGGRPQTPGRAGIAELRRRAAERPQDPAAQADLAVGELLAPGGDPERAGRQIARALRLGPSDERLHLLAGLEHDLHGRPAAALAAYLDALDAARTSRRPGASHVAELALESVAGLSEGAPGWVAAARPRLERALEAPERLGPAARHAAATLLITLAYRRDDPHTVRRIAEDAGCIGRLRVAGPFGPRDLVGFGEAHEAERAGPLADRYDLGPGRGARDTAEVHARGCAAHLGSAQVPGGGTTFAEATIEVAEAGDHVLRLETPNAVEVFVDGERVLQLDRRSVPTARTTLHGLSLAAGRRELTFKVTTRHPNPILIASITRADPPTGGARASDAALALPPGDGYFETYLRGAVAMVRGDPVAAREALRGELTGRDGAAPFLVLRAAVALNEPLRPADMSRDEARRLLRAARRKDARAYAPTLQLARLDAADGRGLQALEALREAETRWPEVVELPLTITDLYLERGWTAQADAATARARRANPDGCRPLRGALAAAERRLRYAQVEELARALVACDARSDALYQTLVRKRAWEEAGSELVRLARLEPPHLRTGILSGQYELARSRGDVAAADAALAELSSLSPRSASYLHARADRLLAQGLRDEARALLSSGMRAEPESLAELHFVARAIGGDFPLEPYRLDGARVIREFEASGRTYDQPEVLVLDYTVVYVFEDGSSMDLTHNIWRVQSEEAVDERGDLAVPDGGRLLRAHTIKPDGRRIEPDAIAGKDTISLPQVAPGDYVEYEYVRFGAPPGAYPGGYIGDRFYFRSFETPYDLSQLTLVLPASMEPVIDPRGPAPAVQARRDGDRHVLRWSVQESRPFVPEPATVAPREWIPSINVGVRATWGSFVESLLDALSDRDVRDPDAARLVARILGEARRASDLEKARRLYAWVLRDVEDTNELFGLAPAMLAERTGNRARVLHYLLRMAGVRSRLVLARSVGGDSTESEVADADTFPNLLVEVGEGADAVFLSTTDRGAPFGYVPALLRGQEALVLAQGAPRVRVPEGEAGADRRSIEAELVLQQDGAARVAVAETFVGAGAIAWRGMLEGIPAAVLEQRFEEAYAARLVPGASLAALRITGREEPEEPLVLEYELEIESIGHRAGATWVVPALFPTQLGATLANVGERAHAQLVAPAIDADVRLRVRLPAGARLVDPPTTTRVAGPGGARYVLEARAEAETLVVTRRTRVPIQRVEPAAYPQLAAFCRSADEADQRELRLRLRP